jgi:hypothetical protein
MTTAQSLHRRGGNQAQLCGPPRHPEQWSDLPAALTAKKWHPGQNQSLDALGPGRSQMDCHPAAEGMADENQLIGELIEDGFDGAGVSGRPGGNDWRGSGAETRQIEGNKRKPL